MYLLGQGFDFPDGTPLLIQTDLPGESIREVVHIIAADTRLVSDELYSYGSRRCCRPSSPGSPGSRRRL